MTSKVEKAFSLWVLLLQTRDALYNARNKELSEYGMSSREAATLHAIYSIGEEATPAKLARWVYRKEHTITGILKRMQNKGLIKLSKDTKMKNLVRITITEEGNTAYKAARKRTSIIRLFHGYTNDDYSGLESRLTILRDAALQPPGVCG